MVKDGIQARLLRELRLNKHQSVAARWWGLEAFVGFVCQDDCKNWTAKLANDDFGLASGIHSVIDVGF